MSVDEGMVGLQPDCLVKVDDGILALPQIGFGKAPISVGEGIFGLQPDCLVKVDDGIQILP